MTTSAICPACGQSTTGNGPCPLCGADAADHGKDIHGTDALATTRALIDAEHREEEGEMTLPPCPACGKPLSSYVTKCPNCGRHTHGHSHDHDANQIVLTHRFLPILAGVIGVVVLAVLIWFLFLREVLQPGPTPL